MKYYLIAGEASGDIHTANLMEAIKKRDFKADFRCWGGDHMLRAGGNLVKHYRDTAIMGFKDVLLNLGTIRKNMKLCKADILEYRPDVLILTDYAGFNLRIAKFAKQHDFKVIWYIAPKVWAWKKSRIKKLKAYTDKVMTIFPFEKAFFKENDLDVDFVGNPLLDVTEPFREKKQARDIFINENGLDSRPIVALLPGSRKSEIHYHMPVFSRLPALFPDYQFVIAAISAVDHELYVPFLDIEGVRFVTDKTYLLLSHSRAAIVASGTATLETAFFEIPQVCCYKGDNFSYQIAKRLVKIDYISLVNLVADKTVIKELIQHEMTLENIAAELKLLLSDKEYVDAMIAAYKQIKEKSGGTGASARAAGIVHSFLKHQTAN